MNNETIVPGVGVGGMTEKYDIKILICYLLDAVRTPLTREQLNAIFQADQLVNYFSFCDAFAELIASGHLSLEQLDGQEVIRLHSLGKETARRLDRSLPRSLRDNVVESALRLIARLKIERENDVQILPCTNGCTVECRMHDGDFDILRLSVYAPDQAQAETIRERFLHDPTRIYQGLIGLLLENEETV